MKVRLIDYTGSGHPDPASYAAKLLIYAKSTRLEQNENTQAKINAMTSYEVDLHLKDISNTIRSSWEFVDYTWEITGVTRAFTHQFVRSRHLSFAQQAMRVSDMSNFDYLLPETVKTANRAVGWRNLMDLIAGFYKEMRSADIPAQDARGVLPTNVKTNIIAKANLRSLSELVGKRLNLRAQDEYAQTIQLMSDVVQEVHPWVKIFLFPPRTATPALDGLLRNLLGNRSPVDAPEINAALKEIDRLKATWG